MNRKEIITSFITLIELALAVFIVHGLWANRGWFVVSLSIIAAMLYCIETLYVKCYDTLHLFKCSKRKLHSKAEEVAELKGRLEELHGEHKQLLDWYNNVRERERKLEAQYQELLNKQPSE